jgi:hypothetical protein
MMTMTTTKETKTTPEQESLSRYLQRRHLNVKLHRPVVDEVERCVTFYFWTVDGKITGYQQHKPDLGKEQYQRLNPGEARYFTYNKSPVHNVWGVESLFQSRGPVFLAEGVFDAARLTEVGQSALAVCCNNPPRDLTNWLQMLARPVVVVCDNDQAGRKLAKFGNFVEVVPFEGGDLGEAPDDYVFHLLNKYNPNRL